MTITHPIEMVRLEDLTPHPENYRGHPDNQLEALRTALRTVGWTRNLVVTRYRRRTTILAGHGVVEAGLLEGVAEAPAVVLKLDPMSTTALQVLVGDNELAWFAETDEAQLARLGRILAERGALDATGLTEDRLAKLEPAASEIDLSGNDDAPGIPKAPDSKRGEVYELGRHRLICGDATDPEVLEALLQGDQPHCMWTDPPYGVNYTGGTPEHLKIANDTPDGLQALLEAAFRAADTHLRPGAAIYIAHPAGPLSTVFTTALATAGWRHRQSLVWDKGTLVLGHSDYHYDHEPILFGRTPDDDAIEYDPEHDAITYGNKPLEGGRFGRGTRGWYGDDSQTSVFRVPKPARSAEHPTMKPVELIAPMIRNSTPPTGLVLDPFAGSGSTLIAAHVLGRTARLVELDPAYCDVIRHRWDAQDAGS